MRWLEPWGRSIRSYERGANWHRNERSDRTPRTGLLALLLGTRTLRGAPRIALSKTAVLASEDIRFRTHLLRGPGRVHRFLPRSASGNNREGHLPWMYFYDP